MARIWIEPAHGTLNDSKFRGTSTSGAATAVAREQVICVHTCSFTFRFSDEDELREYIDFFEQASGSGPLATPAPARWHTQPWYEPLPAYLMEPDKREKVLKALHEAIDMLHAPRA